MTLQEEIRADLESGELNDLFQDVKWNGKPIRALVETAATVEGMDSLGGPMLSGERQFKFERAALVALRSTLKMVNDVITFAGRTYDVDEIEDRPGAAIIIVRGRLRP